MVSRINNIIFLSLYDQRDHITPVAKAIRPISEPEANSANRCLLETAVQSKLFLALCHVGQRVEVFPGGTSAEQRASRAAQPDGVKSLVVCREPPRTTSLSHGLEAHRPLAVSSDRWVTSDSALRRLNIQSHTYRDSGCVKLSNTRFELSVNQRSLQDNSRRHCMKRTRSSDILA